MASSATHAVYKNYYSNKDLVEADHKWESGEADSIFTGPPDDRKPAPGTIKGKPAFQDGVLESIGQPSLKTPFTKGGTMMMRNENWIAVIPGGFRDAPTPNKMNPVKYSIGGETARMSPLHFLLIPERRITNCVTLTEEDIPLIKEGVTFGEKIYKILLNGLADEFGSLRWEFNQRGEIKMKDGTMKDISLNEDDFIDECKPHFHAFKKDPQAFIDDPCLDITFHGDKAASIRKLHMHFFDPRLKTVAFQKQEETALSKGYPKNIPYEEVINMAMSGKTQRMKDEALGVHLHRPATGMNGGFRSISV